MKSKRTIRIGFIGLGVVGQGVWKHLTANVDRLEPRLGARLELTRACVRDLKKKRSVRIPASRLTTNPEDVLDDPKIDIVCELAGGIEDARAYTLKALQAGKVVVSANKALICEHGAELFAAARKSGGHYFFEASVAGGIPIIKALREGLVANRFSLIHGILNGTSNYILTRMEREGLSFEETVGDARKLGYVEADEALDLDGIDAAHKAVILAYLAHGKWIPLSKMLVEGIREITAEDIGFASQLGYKIKLLAVIARDFEKHTVFATVHPALIAKEARLASVDGVYNGVSLRGDVVGTTLLVGRGAGQDATASAVISDIADAVFALLGAPEPVVSEEDADFYSEMARGLKLARLSDVQGRFYLRLHVQDQPGVLSRIAASLARHNVSVARLIQLEGGQPATAPLVLTTHRTNEADIARVCRELERQAIVLGKPFLLRIFEEPED
ncbi:MAG: homoserine dehydrogenase [Opitutales bacterium]